MGGKGSLCLKRVAKAGKGRQKAAKRVAQPKLKPARPPHVSPPTHTATMKPFFDDIDASAKDLYAAYRSKRMLKVNSANEQLFVGLLRSVDRMRLYVNEDFEGLWLMDTDGSQRRTITALEAAAAQVAQAVVAQPAVAQAAVAQAVVTRAAPKTVSIVPAWRRAQPLPNIIVSEPASALTRQSGLNPEATEYRPPYSPLQ